VSLGQRWPGRWGHAKKRFQRQSFSHKREIRGLVMDMLEWARWGAEYLQQVRVSKKEEFDGAIEENKGWYENAVPRGDWREIPKHIANMFYLRSQELVADAAVPGSVFSTPTEFQSKIEEFKQFIEDMRPDLARAIEDANRRFKPVSVPDHIEIIQRLINVMVEAVEYVLSMKPQQAIKDAPGVDAWQLLQRLAANFHESVLALRKHRSCLSDQE
jgi:hypothetical protein